MNHSIGPVWEANHVWLIFVLVVLWTGFSEAFASIMLTLFVPLSLAALGIVLRGSSFAFRKEVARVSSQRNFGATFAIVVGARAVLPRRGRRRDRVGPRARGRRRRRHWSSWLNPTSILGGVLAVTVCAYLAAVYLVWDAHRFGGPDMVEYFRRRAHGRRDRDRRRRDRRDLRAAVRRRLPLRPPHRPARSRS